MFQPMGDRILVLPAEQEDFYDAGKQIAKTDNAKERPQEGTVLAVGPGAYNPVMGSREPIPLKPGDRVLYGKFSGSELRVDGIEMVVLLEDDVLGRIEDGRMEDLIKAAGRQMPKATPHPLAPPEPSRIVSA